MKEQEAAAAAQRTERQASEKRAEALRAEVVRFCVHLCVFVVFVRVCAR